MIFVVFDFSFDSCIQPGPQWVFGRSYIVVSLKEDLPGPIGDAGKHRRFTGSMIILHVFIYSERACGAVERNRAREQRLVERFFKTIFSTKVVTRIERLVPFSWSITRQRSNPRFPLSCNEEAP